MPKTMNEVWQAIREQTVNCELIIDWDSLSGFSAKLNVLAHGRAMIDDPDVFVELTLFWDGPPDSPDQALTAFLAALETLAELSIDAWPILRGEESEALPEGVRLLNIIAVPILDRMGKTI